MWGILKHQCSCTCDAPGGVAGKAAQYTAYNAAQILLCAYYRYRILCFWTRNIFSIFLFGWQWKQVEGENLYWFSLALLMSLSWTSENYLEWDEENMLTAISKGEWWVRWWTRMCLHFNTNWPFGNWNSKNRTVFWNVHTNIAK